MQIIEFPLRQKKKPPFEEVYEHYYRDMLFYTQKKLGNLHDAEDLVGDAFIYCYQHYENYDPEKSSISTWLYLVLNSRIKNYYRDKKQTVDYSALEDWMFAEEPDLERTVYLQEIRKFVSEHVTKLPEQQKNVVLMRYFREMEFADIAEELNTTPGNARVILSRALNRLEREMQENITDWRLS